MVPLSEYRQPISAALAVHQIPQAAWEVLFTDIPRALSVGHEYIAWFGYVYNTRANVTSLFSFTTDVGYFVPCGAIGYFSGIVDGFIFAPCAWEVYPSLPLSIC